MIPAIHRFLRLYVPWAHALVHFVYTLPSATVGLAKLHFRRPDAPIRLVIGATGRFQRGWIPTEIYYLDLLDVANWQRFFAPESVEAVLAEHVWEHLTPAQARVATAHCFTYLKPGGYLRVAVPDGLHPDPSYREAVAPGGTGPGAEDHQVLYTYHSLRRLLQDTGFDVELLEYFDEAGRFHFQPWNPAEGKVHRSKRFDPRNRNDALHYTSLIVDARKPLA